MSVTVFEWIKAPDVPVTVKVYVPLVVCGFDAPEQPARPIRKRIAVVIPSCVRSRRGVNSKKSSVRARTNGTICRQDAGGVGTLGSGINIAVEVTVNVEVTTGGVIEDGIAVQVDNVKAVGSMQVKATAELNPPLGVIVTVYVAGLPFFTVWVAGVTASAKSGAAVPVPVN